VGTRWSAWWLCVLALLLPRVVGPAFSQALQFEFGGANNQWAYFQYGQRGALGFFGPYDRDASTTPGLYSNLNGWMGNRLTDVGILVTGSDAAASSVALSVKPALGNDWIRLAGRYTIRVYDAATAEGVFNPMSTGQLTTWSAYVSLPLATVSYGKRMFFKGLGLQYTSSRSQEYLVMEQQVMAPDILAGLVARGVLPRGVLSWFNPQAWNRYCQCTKTSSTDSASTSNGASTTENADTSEGIPDLRDPADKEDEEPDNTIKGSFAGVKGCDGWFTFGFGVMPWQRILTATDTRYDWAGKDLNASRGQNLIAYVNYSTNDLETGVGITRTTFHEGPELVQDPAIRVHTPTRETYVTEGWAFLKWSNGRFFINTELDWFNRILRFQRTIDGLVFDPAHPLVPLPEFYTDGSGRSRFAPQYSESWRFMAETGIFLGSAAGRVFYAFMPGQDRRHGILIDRQPFIQEDLQAATDVFDPYSILFSFQFGGGVNAPAHISAASVYAAKVDYSLAANLIVSASVMHAVRNSQGYGWGYIRPTVTGTVTTLLGTVDYAPRGTFTEPPPAIPNNDLGWEFVSGITWQLLEGCYFDARISYWKPGKWFSYACIDRTVPSWDVPIAANNWGVNPNRDIDGMYGFEIRLAASY
jgi:hypothetical protein